MVASKYAEENTVWKRLRAYKTAPARADPSPDTVTWALYHYVPRELMQHT